MLTVQVESHGDLERFAAHVRGELEKLPGALTQNDTAHGWGAKLVAWQQQNIERSTSPDGEPFAPLSPVTLARRTADALSAARAGGRQVRRSRTGHPYGDKPLIDTSAMFSTMKWEFPGPNEVTGGAIARSREGFPYPAAHQTGTRRMPARPWSGLRAENLVELETDTRQAAIAALERARGGA